MTYELAPATKMIATHCAVCARPLLDAESVERGIGPDCAKKHGFGKAQEEPNWLAVGVALAELPDGSVEQKLVETADARKLVNLLVHRIAVDQAGAAVNAYTNAIHAAGFVKLAERVAKRVAPIAVEVDGAYLIVKAPYSESAVVAFRSIPGKSWDASAKRTRVPAQSAHALYSALCAAYGAAAAVRTADGIVGAAKLLAAAPTPTKAQLALPLPVEPTIFVERRADGRITLRAPYSAAATERFRAIDGRRWEPATKLNVFPSSAGFALQRALEACYPGHVGEGPKGRFVVGAKESAAA